MEFTENDKKLLNGLSLLIKSNGCDKAQLGIQIYSDDSPYPDVLRCGYKTIDYFNIFDTIFSRFYENDEFINSIFDDVEDFIYGEVNVNIDTKKRELTLTATYNYYDTDCSEPEFDLDDDFADHNEQENLKEYFRNMKESGNKLGTINFNGGGDNGYIEDFMILEDGDNQSVPEYILDLCYDLLQRHFGGWEINEGSQGNFLLDFETNKIHLRYCENIESTDDLDVDFPVIKF